MSGDGVAIFARGPDPCLGKDAAPVLSGYREKVSDGRGSVWIKRGARLFLFKPVALTRFCVVVCVETVESSMFPGCI